jgi:hypothetical protein
MTCATFSLLDLMRPSGRKQIEIPKIEDRMSNQEFRMMKLNLFFCFRRCSLFDLPAVPVNRFHVELPALNQHGFRPGTKHFAGQAGILRLTRLWRVRF